LGDDPFASLARAFGRGGGRALFAQNVHGGVQVAFGFRQRLFAIHHAGVGHLAQFGHGGSSNLSHKNQ